MCASGRAASCRDRQPASMIRVIINADDFGLSPGVNRGIVTAFREGVLSSATLMANMPGFADAVRLARENPDLPVGVHLSLLWGPPVAGADRVPSLVEKSGDFPSSLASFALRYAAGRVADADVRTELRAQLARVVDAGITPTHVDTHKHVHCFPRVLDAVIDAAKVFGIARVRLPVEEGRPASAASWAKVQFARAMLHDARAKLAAAGLRTTDRFAGLGEARLDAGALDRILARLRPGTTEIMCHPGAAEDAASPYARAGLDRAAELEALTDPRMKSRLAAAGARLISFAEI